MSWSLSLLFWCPMILVFSIIVSLFPGSGVSYYGLSFSLFLSLSLSLSLNPVLYGLVSLFWCFGVSMVWSLCSGALVFL
ncbi:hypothetical protein EDC96DRAFT_536188, partial [Choanephora cucurbitarum]